MDLQLGTCTCENRYFAGSRLFMHAVKSFQSEFLQRIPVICTDNENIYIYFTVKSFFGGGVRIKKFPRTLMLCRGSDG